MKEKVYIVLSHKHSLRKGSRTEWEVSESVEFVNQLRNKHLSMSSAIGDYLERKMLTGERKGMGDYAKFEEYVNKKYPKQLAELEEAYSSLRVPAPPEPVVTTITDKFGNVREPTVFDV
jgi:hypothetical protein